ncbi:ribonuclease H-like domain-containing protein [Mycobacterium sp. NPDC051804]|uniref:ribonuclease H-like domain-containing protein n=1 Tax=Mycobacterium sp. NPDC051804 TaxID=3364295 RepID=UPI0037A6B881
MATPVLLGGYAAKRCPVRVQNDFSPEVETLKWSPSAEDLARLRAGNDFEAMIFAQLASIHPECAQISTGSKADAIAATVAAMDADVGLILGGWLPDDPLGGRTGRPDILIRVDGGYLPADVKNHKTMGPAAKASTVLSPLSRPSSRRPVTALTTATSHRFDDGMQLAHYTRMLQACGRHPGDEFLIGAVLGTSEVSLDGHAPTERMFVWHDLSERVATTYSRRFGKAKRSLLERYDHEFRFRVKVAEHALQIIGREDDPEPLVTPIGQAECGTCPYEVPCAEAMGDDPSAAITVGRLNTREWLTLRSLGVATTLELADLDPDDTAFFDLYAEEVAHHSRENARKRLVVAIERAAMIRDGIEFWPNSDAPVEVPTATIEIDLDVESDQHGRVYMWGACIRRGADDAWATYISDFTAWDPLDNATEYALASRFVEWLRSQRADAVANGGTLRVFHWSHPEWSNLKRILGADAVRDLIGHGGSDGLDGYHAGVFIDLEKVFKRHFTTLRGTSLKKVAPLFGFHWHVPDPGGDVSQTYLSTIYTSPDESKVAAAKAWLLSYNEDDNRAMTVIRDGMRAWRP